MSNQAMQTTSYRTSAEAAAGVARVVDHLDLGSASELMRMLGENADVVAAALRPVAQAFRVKRVEERTLREMRRKVEREMRAKLAAQVREMSADELQAQLVETTEVKS